MKKEQELKSKLSIYQNIMADLKATELLDKRRIFMPLNEFCPMIAFELRQGSPGIDDIFNILPSEDRAWPRHMIDKSYEYLKEALGERITILKWILDEPLQ